MGEGNERLSRKREDATSKPEVLDATKEASVQIMKKFSIDFALMEKAAYAIQTAVEKYKRLKPTDNEMGDLRNLAVDVMEQTLSEQHMHTPDIMQEFERVLDERLPA